jgi:hypothetical protein
MGKSLDLAHAMLRLYYSVLNWANSECYWGNELASTSTSIGSGCNTPCNGAPSELCGGGDAINLYEDTAYRTANQVPYVGDYVLRGCYVDSATSRTLQAGGYQDWYVKSPAV